MTAKLYSTSEIDDLILTRYAAPEWSLLPGVSDSTGARQTRTCDWLAMSLWPSRGLALHGLEVKSSRGDWLRELKNPAKAEAIACYCDYWWVITGHADVAPKEEIPEAWGLMVAKGGKLWTVKEAVKTDAKEMSRAFLAAVLRQVHEHEAPEAKIQKRIANEIRKDREVRKKDDERWRIELEERDQWISDFEKKSGVQLRQWNYGNVAEAVALLRDSGADGIASGIARSRDVVARLLANLDAGLAELRERKVSA